MIKKLYLFITLGLVVIGSGLVFSAPAYAKCTDSYFGVPTWYRGMMDSNCTFVPPETDGQPDARKLVIRVAGNILQAAMVIVAYVTIFFLIKGGFMYITSAGSSDGMAAAKKTITNALTGLVISVLAASIVNAIAGAIK